ncbi:DedA family protein [Candidatus Paracaedibacter symbiosus]|uniref:DedA family protein n=1 Tax=Candidatus Paracaedibacter symbiosus TaxID=244582 RepID=UPI000509EBF5|nr:DedA family protein [Candidatus Paracaedibacter symbiosus]
MEHLIEWIQTWGYAVVLLGAMIEGESVILTACVMAYLGYLSLLKVVIIAFLGTLIADQILYYVGRHYGGRILDRYPKMRAPAEKAFQLLHKWDIWFILSFRFIYGIRMISPVVIGSAGIPPSRFIPLNFIAAVVWTAISCTGGYLLGGIIEAIDFKVIEKYIALFSILLLVILMSLGYLAWKKLHSPAQLPKDEEK